MWSAPIESCMSGVHTQSLIKTFFDSIFLSVALSQERFFSLKLKYYFCLEFS